MDKECLGILWTSLITFLVSQIFQNKVFKNRVYIISDNILIDKTLLQ